MFDVLIINGNLVDGTGKKASKGDIGIIADKIDQIGNLKDSSAKKIIDATGKTLSPGFIDTHAHSDAALLIDPIHENGIRQGITTEILGQDGLSYAPLSKENYLLNKNFTAAIQGKPPKCTKKHWSGRRCSSTSFGRRSSILPTPRDH